MCVAAAIGGSAVLGAVMNKHASDGAARAQREGAASANKTLQDQYNQTREDLGGYRGAGNTALQQLMGYYGMGSAGSNVDYQKILSGLPGYQFQMQSGAKAVDQNLAARGLLQSGAAGKALTQYGQGLGSQYGQQYASGLMGIANLGESAAAQTGAFGQNTANNISGNQTYAGNANAQGSLNTGAAWNQGLQGLAGAAGLYQGMQGMGQQPMNYGQSSSGPMFTDNNPWPISGLT